MAPSPDWSASSLQAALELLAQCEDTCRRISIRSAVHHPSEGPLTVLLRQHSKTLEADLHCLTARISQLRPNDSDGSVVSPEVLQALDSTKRRLFELLDLQNFHSREEQGGHDGALNVLFARRFILTDSACPDTARAYYNEDKLTRIDLELRDLLQEVLPASVPRGAFCQDGYQRFV